MIFASDLDRTLIYSQRFLDDAKDLKAKCIEILNGKEISYMSEKAIALLNELVNQEKIIPVTTRSIEQFRRVKPFQNCQYAITSNGGTILYFGQVLEEWESRIKDIVSKNMDQMEKIMEGIEKQGFFIYQPKLVDNKFIFTKTDDVDKCREYLEKVINPSVFQYSIQGQKAYVIPSEISKEEALKFLKRKLGEKELIVAGDSNLDADMLNFADIALIPGHSELKIDKPNTVYISSTGLKAGEDILRVVVEKL